MAAPLAKDRLTVTESAQTDIGFATETLETAIIEGTFRNDSPELTKALAALREASGAVRDLEIFTRSSMRESR